MRHNDDSKQTRLTYVGTLTSKTRVTGPKTWLGACEFVGMAMALLWLQPAGAVTITPVSQGQLPSGQIIQIVMIVINPGETIPWHYHTGTGWLTVVSGTVTEDVGCGSAMVSHTAGSATMEPPGRVHRLFNFGQEPVVCTGAAIFPGCDPNNGTVFVNGPHCLGNSGKSQREPVPDCGDPGDESADR